MNKLFIFLYIILLGTMLACEEQENNDFIPESKEATFSISTEPGGIKTRATDVNFETGDRIGIFVVKRSDPDIQGTLQPSGNYADNKLYIINSSGKLEPRSESDKIYLLPGDVYDCYAIYPYQQIESTKHPITIPTDQSIKEDYQKSDLMFAKTLGIKNIYSSIDLSFRHLMALVEVHLKKEPDLFISQIELVNCKRKASLDLASGTLKDVNFQGKIKMHKFAENDSYYTFRAIIPEQTFICRNPIFSVYKSNSRYENYKVNKELHAPAGVKTIYEFNMQYVLNPYSISPEMGSVSGYGIFNHGDNVTVYALPKEGYLFESWKDINGRVLSYDQNYSFRITELLNIGASFKPKTYQITTTSNSPTWSTGKVQGSGSYSYGSQCTVNAIPADEYCRFFGWYENDVLVSTDMNYTFPVTENRILLAKFDRAIGQGELGLKLAYDKYAKRFSDLAIKDLYIEAGAKILSNVHMSYEITGGNHYSPFTINFSAEIIRDGETVFVSPRPENFTYVIPKSGNYTFYYHMDIAGLNDDETVIGWGTWHNFIWKN